MTTRSLLAACVVGALLLRGAAMLAAPRYAYLWDHVAFMAWADWAYTHGPTQIYDFPKGRPIPVRVPTNEGDGWTIRVVPTPSAVNYPPLAAVVFWLQGFLWHRLDADVRVLERAPSLSAGADGERAGVRSRVANTAVARLVNALPGIVADLMMAWGVMLLVRALGDGARDRRAEVTAFALVAGAPPFVLDAAFWGQTDSWVSALLVWCLYAAVRGRFAGAGTLYALAVVIKAQALILAPVLGCLAVALLAGTPGGGRAVARGSVAAVITVLLVVAPFALARDAAGERHPRTWLEHAYTGPILAQDAYTTMKAFNLWWLEVAAENPASPLLDARARVLGASKDAWGRGLGLLGTTLAIVLCVRRWGWAPRGWIALAFLVLLTAFVLPTRVRERYIYYCLPFLIAMAPSFRPWTVSLVGLLVVASLELTWNLWYVPGTAGARIVGGGLAALVVLLYAYSLAAAALARSPTPRARPPHRRPAHR